MPPTNPPSGKPGDAGGSRPGKADWRAKAKTPAAGSRPAAGPGSTWREKTDIEYRRAKRRYRMKLLGLVFGSVALVAWLAYLYVYPLFWRQTPFFAVAVTQYGPSAESLGYSLILPNGWAKEDADRFETPHRQADRRILQGGLRPVGNDPGRLPGLAGTHPQVARRRAGPQCPGRVSQHARRGEQGRRGLPDPARRLAAGKRKVAPPVPGAQVSLPRRGQGQAPCPEAGDPRLQPHGRGLGPRTALQRLRRRPRSRPAKGRRPRPGPPQFHQPRPDRLDFAGAVAGFGLRLLRVARADGLGRPRRRGQRRRRSLALGVGAVRGQIRQAVGSREPGRRPGAHAGPRRRSGYRAGLFPDRQGTRPGRERAGARGRPARPPMEGRRGAVGEARGAGEEGRMAQRSARLGGVPARTRATGAARALRAKPIARSSTSEEADSPIWPRSSARTRSRRACGPTACRWRRGFRAIRRVDAEAERLRAAVGEDAGQVRRGGRQAVIRISSRRRPAGAGAWSIPRGIDGRTTSWRSSRKRGRAARPT